MTDTLTLTPENTAQIAKDLSRKRYGGLNIKPVSTLDSGLVMAIFAPGGVGKTTLAASITDSVHGSPALFLNCIGNPHVVSSYSDKIDVAEITSFNDIEKVRSDLDKDPKCQYKTLVYDTVTAMIGLRLRELYGAVADVDWTKHSATTADILQMVLNAVLMSVGPHKMNIIFTFQEVTEERTINGVKGFRSEIAANKAVQSQFPGIVPFLGRLYIDQDTRPFNRMLDFTPVEKLHQAKIQRDPNHPTAGTIPMQIYKPSLAPLLETMMGLSPFPVDQHKKTLGG